LGLTGKSAVNRATGWTKRQAVQAWLGHATPTITLETYVHLLDEGVGEPLDLSAVSSVEAGI
jgi:integrase